MEKQFDIKQCLPHLKAILIFLIISFVYFSPDIFEGKAILGGDVKSGIGMGQEVKKFREQEGEFSRWTNSMFGGMPNYQIAPSYTSNKVINTLKSIYQLYLPAPVSYIFIMMLGFYIMLIVFGARSDIAVLGSIAYAFSSYFFIIIEAGHIWKLLTLAYIPPAFAGIVLTYKGKYIAGGIIATIFFAFQISANHIQMTYYFLFIVLAYVVSTFIDYYKNRELPAFFKASTTCIVAGLLAVAINSSNLYHTWQYSKESIRGKSELTHDSENKTSTGVDRNYMVNWSYGIGETWTLLIPNTKGGATGYIGQNEKMKEVPQEYQQAIAGQNQYWGDQPFTAGPTYAGAFIITLFIMGLFLVKSRFKWALLAVTILSILLAWGKHFMGLTNLFADYFPLYSKFRAVSSMLIIAEITMPLLAVLTLKEIIQNPKILIEQKKKVFISFALTGGFALLFALFPTLFFNFLSAQESEVYLGQAAKNPQLMGIIDALENIRISIFRSDAWRSFIVIAIGGGLLYLLAKNKLKNNVFVILLTLLVLIDMWAVNKRYLNSDSMALKKDIRNTEALFPKTAADIEILKDTDPNFRVLNTTVSTFNDATTSFYHKSVGGYNAAKLRRYQELIEHHLEKGNMNVLNMLNTKYIITADRNRNIVAQRNPMAAGNAWFIDSLQWVNNPNEEIDAITDFDPHKTAFIDKRFKQILEGKTFSKDSLSDIKLISYKPNELIYKSTSGENGFAVFSEIYYPHGWSATIDGKTEPIVRVNYVLRGLYIPAGEHEIIFSFKPASITTTETIAYTGISICALAMLVLGIITIRKRKQDIQ